MATEQRQHIEERLDRLEDGQNRLEQEQKDHRAETRAGFEEARRDRARLEQETRAGFEEARRERGSLAQEVRSGFEEAREERAQHQRSIERLQHDIGVLRGVHAQNVGVSRAIIIADDLGLTWQRNLSAAELAEISRSDGASRIPSNERRSFMEADLVMEALDSEGEPCYVAVEISYTANGRDTRRAMRNARILAELTGVAARPVIVGNRLDDRVRSEVESGSVAWHPLPDDSLEAR